MTADVLQVVRLELALGRVVRGVVHCQCFVSRPINTMNWRRVLWSQSEPSTWRGKNEVINKMVNDRRVLPFTLPVDPLNIPTVLCRARVGHAYFTNGYLLRGELRPMCCNTRLTIRHVLLSCAKYPHIRRKYFAFNSLFELFRDTPAGSIIQFPRECNLYYMF